VGAVHNIVDDKVAERRWLLTIAPVHHTPMSKKAGRAINKRIKQLSRALDRMTPWSARDRVARLKKRVQKVDKDEQQKAVKESEAVAKRFGLT
jgi:hypothetical protein